MKRVEIVNTQPEYAISINGAADGVDDVLLHDLKSENKKSES